MWIATLATCFLLGCRTAYARPSPCLGSENHAKVRRSTMGISPFSTQDDSLSPSSSARQFSCHPLTQGLSASDCEHMASIGMIAQGRNDVTGNGGIWIGADGPNTFIFISAAGMPITVIVWYKAPGDDGASFMNVRQPRISYSLPFAGSAVEISVANGVSGGFSGLYNRSTQLTPYGQISNTLGEFSTGRWATVDISRLVNTSGNPMTVEVFGTGPSNEASEPACVTDLHTCAYTCNSAQVSSCGEAGTYNLINCNGPNAEQGADADGNPTGGCHGWSNGGRLVVVLM